MASQGQIQPQLSPKPPMAGYGWLHHPPPPLVCKHVRTDAYKALGTPYGCDRALARIFTGHNTDTAYMSGSARAMAFHKKQQAVALRQAEARAENPPSEQAVANWLINQGWQPTPHGQAWHHAQSGLSIQGPRSGQQIAVANKRAQPDTSQLHAHKLCEAWRATQFQSWTTSTRIDAVQSEHPTHSETCTKQARQHAKNSTHHHFTIMTGGIVSQARMASTTGPAIAANPHYLQDDDERIACNMCHEAAGTWGHAVWQCAQNPAPVPIPRDAMQRRLGWPDTAQDTHYNTQVLAHMVATRDTGQNTTRKRSHHDTTAPCGQPRHLGRGRFAHRQAV